MAFAQTGKADPDAGTVFDRLGSVGEYLGGGVAEFLLRLPVLRLIVRCCK